MLERRQFLRLGLLSSLGLLAGCQRAEPVVSVAPTLSPTPSDGHEFIVRNRRPKDLETPVEAFQTYLTPNDRFFIRSHHPEPKLKESEWRLKIEAPQTEATEIDLAKLKEFEPATVTAVLQCAGNSRSLYRPRIPGVQWGRGAVGNAEWRGARLADVLKHCGLDENSPDCVVVSGDDKPLMETVPVFERQIPLTKALHPDTLLAYEMNGEPLPRLHGGPVRLVVPGWVGDDWIKWVSSIRLQNEPCESFYYKKGYRYPMVPCPKGGSVAAEHMKPMEELVTRSLFAQPLQGQQIAISKSVQLQGVAWSGGDKFIKQVQVSEDGGETWSDAALENEAKPYSWRIWRLNWTPKAKGKITLLCRAVDNCDFAQPVEDSPWNPGGYLWGSADRLDIEVVG